MRDNDSLILESLYSSILLNESSDDNVDVSFDQIKNLRLKISRGENIDLNEIESLFKKDRAMMDLLFSNLFDLDIKLPSEILDFIFIKMAYNPNVYYKYVNIVTEKCISNPSEYLIDIILKYDLLYSFFDKLIEQNKENNVPEKIKKAIINSEISSFDVIRIFLQNNKNIPKYVIDGFLNSIIKTPEEFNRKAYLLTRGHGINFPDDVLENFINEFFNYININQNKINFIIAGSGIVEIMINFVLDKKIEIPIHILNILKKMKGNIEYSKLLEKLSETKTDAYFSNKIGESNQEIDYKSVSEKTNRLADFISLSEMSKKENEMSDEFKRFTYYPKVRAEQYNNTFEGAFIHTTHSLEHLLQLYTKKPEKHSEICVSTLRYDSTFDIGLGRDFAIVGFGEIKYLYNFDAFSEKLINGKRIAKASGSKNNDIEKNIFYRGPVEDIINGYNEKTHYDEGFMDIKNCEILIFIALSNKEKIYLKTLLKKFGIFAKIIIYEQFKKIHSSDQLLNLLYKIKDEKDDLELSNTTLGMYDESKKILTFKNFIEKTHLISDNFIFPVIPS